MRSTAGLAATVAAAAALVAAAACTGAPATGVDEAGAGADATATARPRTMPPTLATALATATPTAPATPPTATMAATAPATATATSTPACAPCWGSPEVAGTFDVDAVPEASGLVASRRAPGGGWIADDGPVARLVALAADGSTTGVAELTGFDPQDVEALAAGPCAPTPGTCLHVGDLGDNEADRSAVAVARFREPDPAAHAAVQVEVVALAYAGGPVDAEALLVDDDGTLVVVAKDASVHAGAFADGVLEPRGVLVLPAPARPLQSLVLGVQVTAADAAPDGRVLVRTYDSVVELAPPFAGAPLADLATWTAREVPSAVEGQSEGLAVAPDGGSYTTVGEGAGELWTVRAT